MTQPRAIPVRKRLGTAGYVRVLAALPGTAEQVHKRTGICEGTVRVLLREFRQLRLIHCARTVPGRLRSGPVAVWARGEGPAPINARQITSRPRLQSIAFASLIRALQTPHTITELQQETQLANPVVRRTVKALRDAGLSHVAEWQRSGRGNFPTACHVYGRGKDAQRPAPLTRQQINAKHNAANYARRRMQQLLQRMAGPVREMEAA